MQWIDATHLEKWADRRDCQEYLSLVIRRLIRATAKDITSINFPAGESIVYSGWDGVLKAAEGNEYIPEGLSVWEIGTSKYIKGKAKKDYKKRKENPRGVNPSETTFIFVTSRVWTGKDEWCEEKKKENYWKDVRCHDAIILEQWLEQAPGVGAWLARYLNISSNGTVALDDWWNEWRSVTNPPLTAKLVLAGRDNQTNEIKKWLSAPSSEKAVQADTKEESIAFLAAVIATLPESEREFYFSRSLVIENLEAFRQITAIGRDGLLLIPEFEEIEKIPFAKAREKGCYVYIPLAPDNKVTAEKEKITLLRLGRDAFISALKEMGLSEEVTQKYSRETGRSLTVLRRRLRKIKEQPKWAKVDSVRDIVPALLAGQWNESKEADKEVISQLAGEPYESYSKKISLWLHKSDPPILKIGRHWRLQSSLDAWFAVASFLTEEGDLQQFKLVTLKVLKSIDPALDLEPEKRWMASVYGKEPVYSGKLREGLAQTLVLIAVFGGDAQLPLSTPPQTWVNNVAQELLHDADWKLWYSLSDVLPLIAEASPSSFLDAVESSLSQEQPPIMGMFSETENTFTSSSAHPSLLWALESLAWDPKLVGHVTLILGKLARLDLKGKLSNRPANSLRTIFLLWLPHTYAPLEKRLEAIDTLIEREPEVGWELLIALIPRIHDSCSSTYKPRWRQFSERTKNSITTAEHLEGIKAITERLLQHVGNDGHRWVNILDNFSSLPSEERNKIIEKLSACVDKISNRRSELWNKIRAMLSHHRSFPDAAWALPEQELKKIEKIYQLIEPEDIIERFCWLFDEHLPDLPEGTEKGDYKKAEKLIAEIRKEVIKTIKSEHGFEVIIKLVEQTKNPQLVGNSVAEIDINSEEEQKLFSLLENEDRNKVSFVQNYIFRKSFNQGDEWIDSIVETARLQQWSTLKTINLFLSFSQNKFVWNLLEPFDEDIQDGYWKQCVVRLFNLPVEDKVYALKQLLGVKRHFSALDTAALSIEKIPADLIAEILQKAATEKSEEKLHIESYDVERLFEVLDKSPSIKEEKIARLEWLYLPILAGVGSSRPPKMLHKELANNPEFFAEVIKNVYKPKNKDRKEKENLPQELIKQRANLAWELLHSWKTIPGSGEKGRIDYEKLKVWVDKARELCEKENRKEVGDSHIGQVLVHSVLEEEGIWPPEAACKIIDEIRSDKLDSGFMTGVYNERGVVIKSPFEDGQQERALAEQFRQYADIWNTFYPRTSAILEKIANLYEDAAKREDLEAERRDLEY